jgi:PAS domain S-box-containing protein
MTTTVLVVDDSTTNRELMHNLLDLEGYAVLEASSGTDALMLARREHPEVVITDVLMPGIDGYELTRLLREDPETADTPVVLYSGNYAEQEMRQVASAYRVDQVVTKSSDPQPLLDAIHAVLAEHRPHGSRGIDTGADLDHLHLINDKLVDTLELLQGSRERFRALVEAAPVGIVVADAAGEAGYVNPALIRIMATSAGDQAGAGWLACLMADQRAEVLAALAIQHAHGWETRFRNAVTAGDGSARWLDVHVSLTTDGQGRTNGLIAVVDDITAVVQGDQERHAGELSHEADNRNRMAERLESVRRLAGGVAHDYNNILAVILSYSSTLEESIESAVLVGRLDAETATDLRGALDRIVHAGQRAVRINQQLMFFGHPGVLSAVPVDITACVRGEAEAIRALLRPGALVELDLAPDLPMALVDPSLIGQMLRHLAANAADAMLDGGTLRLETAIWSPGRSAGVHSHLLGAGQYVRLTVRDTGHGMSPHVLEHATEPFYTTKSRADGSGLGLTTVQGVAQQAGGDLVIQSATDRGTSVHVILPVAGVAPAPATPAPAAGTVAGASQTILVVDDEEPLRQIIVRMLVAAGYHVLSAGSGGEALELVQRLAEPPHCLLTDLVMPGMTGTELAQRVHVEHAGLPVLFMSGYAEPLIASAGSADTTVNVLAKPFRKEDLLAALRAALAQRQPAGAD